VATDNQFMLENNPSPGPFILFITGASASGKSTLYNSLRADEGLAHLRFHDIDEDGVPRAGGGPWRQFRVEELFYEATEALKEGYSTVICGITKPHEVIESLNFNPDDRVHFLVIEIPFATLEERLRARIMSQIEVAGFDEYLKPGAIEALLVGNRSLQRVLRNSVSQQRRGHFLEVGGQTPGEAHVTLVALIHQIATSADDLEESLGTE
jgi:hypothetical protein